MSGVRMKVRNDAAAAEQSTPAANAARRTLRGTEAHTPRPCLSRHAPAHTKYAAGRSQTFENAKTVPRKFPGETA